MANIENSSIVVQWDEVNDSLPTTYTVNWTIDGTDSIQSQTLIEQSSYTITGLTLDTIYTITVNATNICGTGPENSTRVSLTTDTTSSKTSAITVIAASTTTTTETTNLMTISTNPNAFITSTYTTTFTMSPLSTTHPIDTSTADENSKILTISICN